MPGDHVLDELRGYLVWRDSKGALVMFIKTKYPAATVEKLHAAVETHPSHALTKDATDPGSRVDYVITADDEASLVGGVPGGHQSGQAVR